MTRETCANIGGYFAASNVSYTTTSSSVPTTTRRWSSSTTDSEPEPESPPYTTSSRYECYYNTFSCPGNAYNSQCYSGRSSALSCPTCKNIGGVFRVNYGCYYYSDNCTQFSAGGQCHTNRYCSQTFESLPTCCSYFTQLQATKDLHNLFDKKLSISISYKFI